MIDPKLLVCSKCSGKITTAEYTSYGPRCENCYVGNPMSSTGPFAAAIRNGFVTDRHAKTCRNSIKSGG